MIQALRRPLALLCLIVLLSGCATRDYVVLVENPNGELGEVVITDSREQTTLNRLRQGAPLGAASQGMKPFQVSQARISRDFSTALAAMPARPQQFLVYFETGDAELTAASKLAVGEVLEAIRTRGPSAVSVIGHTDTLGGARRNEQLGLIRAKKVAALLRSYQPDVIDIRVSSHGERNLLIPTPNWVSEPRNRRVEISVR